MNYETTPIPVTEIEQRIMLLRGQKVMLDRDLASLYGVPTKVLKRAVRRNAERFPDDFMFVLNAQESADWRRQFGASNADRMGLRYAPMAFTEQGVAMLSSVLNSPHAVRVNIEIMRAFVRLRQWLASNAELARKLAELEQKYDAQFRVVFDAIRQAALKVGGEAHVQVTAVHGDEHVDAVLEARRHPRSRTGLTSRRKSEMRMETRRNGPCFSFSGAENQGGRQCSRTFGSLHRHTATRSVCCVAPVVGLEPTT